MSVDPIEFLLGLAVNAVSPPPPPPVVSSWSLTDKNAGIALSGSNYVATGNNSGEGIRGAQSHSTGKWHFELTVTFAGNLGGIGIATTFASLSSGPGFQGMATDQPTSAFFVNGTSIGGAPTYTTGAVISIELDLDLKLMFIQVGAGARTGGFDISTLTAGPAVFPFYVCGNNGGSCTLNNGQTAFAVTPTAGFSAWG